jgi:(p)ppGpp synthase/HD superfamily hydrolase
LPESNLEDAIELALNKFRGVTDKGGQPYLLHCLRVMLTVTDPLARQVAVMHDLIEDTDVTIDDLRARGFSQQVIDGVACMTHTNQIPYAQYVLRLKSNTLARQVKLADLRDNYALDRVAYRESQATTDASRLQRYILSFQFLSDAIDEETYLRQMSKLE